MAGCLDEDGVVELLHGALSPAAKEIVAAHLGSCGACRKLVAEATLALSGPAQGGWDTAPLHAGATLGRYVVIAPVGGGAMGLVYSAYDRELGRKVALKLLRPAAVGSGAAEVLRARLKREAQALAQLTHPNVVAVHDVDSFEGRIFLAMEFVEGETLSTWLRKRRSWREVVEVFRQAGEGLAAAHAAGLVHRDFKPDNVLVGADGRVRVTDFGLARASELPAPARVAGDGAPALDSSLTETGALIGTPAYMSPEQLSPGGRPDGLSDQFSYCVAFYEALFGERPFRAGDVAALQAAVREGRLREPPRGVRVPGWLLRIVRRGLLAEPSARFPSMRALLGQLSRGPLLTPARAAAAAAAAALLALFAWSSRDVCAGVDRSWGTLWSEEQRAAVRTAFAALGEPSSEEIFARADRGLSRFRTAWSAMRVDACNAARARHEQSETLLELRVLCLEDRRREAAELVHLFEAPTAATVEHAIAAVDRLTPLSRCAATRELIERDPPPTEPAARAQMEEASALLAQAKAFGDAENPDPAVPLAERAVAAARRSGHKPTEARALYSLTNVARAKWMKSRFAQLEEWLHLAAAIAQEGRDDGVAADAFILLSFLRGYERASQSEAELWSRYAAAAIVRLGGDEVREAYRLERLAGVYLNDEAHAHVAREHLLAARALYVHAGAPEGRSAMLDDPLASVAVITGQVEEGIRLYRGVIEAKVRLYGSSRPTHTDDNLGEALRLAHRPLEAIATHRRVWEEMHHNAWYTAQKLAQAIRAAGQDVSEALALDRKAIEILESRSGPDNPHLMGPLVGLGEDLMALGMPRAALAPLERAVRLPSGVSDENPATARFALARALRDSGADLARALSLAAEARELLRAQAARHGSYYGEQLAEVDRWLEAAARPARGRPPGTRPAGRTQ